MSQRVIVEALGALIEIDATARSAASFAAIQAAWAAGTSHGSPADATVAVSAEHDDDVMLSVLSTDVTLAALAHRRGELWMLHAAGLADEQGRTVALVAPSGTGKTTAARVLSRDLAYVSDESVGVDPRGGVVAYRKPLSIIETDDAPKTQVSTATLPGVPWHPTSLRLAKIAVLDRDPEGPDEPVIMPLDLAEALALLGPQTSYFCDLPGGLRAAAALLEATGGAVRIRYREAETLRPVMRELLKSDPAHGAKPAERRALRDFTGSAPNDGRIRYHHAAMVDELLLDGGAIAVLRRGGEGGELRVLDGVGPAIWEAAHGADFEEIHANVVAVHGAPDGIDTRAVLADTLSELLRDGTLANEPSWCLADGVHWVTEQDRTTVFTPDGGNPAVVFEGVSHTIWQALAAEIAIPQSVLVRRVAKNADAVDDVRDDTVAILAKMNRQGLVGLT